MNVELYPGKNVISFSTNASTNLSSWQTGSNGEPLGSVSFSVPQLHFTYVIVYSGVNGGKWKFKCTASTGKHTGGPYMSSDYAPLTLKAGPCSIRITCFSLGALVDVGTQFAVSIADNIFLDVDIYYCTRCGRTETYGFSNGTSALSLNDYEDYPDEDIIYAEDVSLSKDDSTVHEDKDIIDNTETSTEETDKDIFNSSEASAEDESV